MRRKWSRGSSEKEEIDDEEEGEGEQDGTRQGSIRVKEEKNGNEDGELRYQGRKGCILFGEEVERR